MTMINEKNIQTYQNRKGTINKCKECTGLVCCGLSQEGGIIEPPYLTKHDIEQIEYFTGLDKEYFAKKKKHPLTGRIISIMRIDHGGGCVFFNKHDGKCKIHLFRPMDCRLFPLDIEIENGIYYWTLYKYKQCNMPKEDLVSLLAYREEALQILDNEMHDYASYPVPGMQKIGYKILMKVGS